MLLAGDIGGTKTVLALFEESEGNLTKVREATFPSRAYDTFDKLLLEFLANRAEGAPRAACFGVAGIVVDGHSDATNLAWSL
ncbi:glucokinase, partial [Singulisphaera rosea]